MLPFGAILGLNSTGIKLAKQFVKDKALMIIR